MREISRDAVLSPHISPASVEGDFRPRSDFY